MAGSMGDIGTHAFNLAEYVSGLETTEICADINIIVEGRKLDDDGAVLVKYNNGASGVLFATQVAAGEENNANEIHTFVSRQFSFPTNHFFVRAVNSVNWKRQGFSSLF